MSFFRKRVSVVEVEGAKVGGLDLYVRVKTCGGAIFPIWAGTLQAFGSMGGFWVRRMARCKLCVLHFSVAS